MGAFRALVLMATSATTNLAAYKSALDRFCGAHGLKYDSSELVGLGAIVMADAQRAAGSPEDPGLSRERSVIERAPEQIYAEVVASLAAVDPQAMVALSAQLESIDLKGDTIIAVARRADGQAGKVVLRQTDLGWVLSSMQ
jgi:hypothetical protein